MFYTNCSDLFLSVGVIILVDLSPHSLSVLSSRNISLIHYYKWNSIFISIFNTTEGSSIEFLTVLGISSKDPQQNKTAGSIFNKTYFHVKKKVFFNSNFAIQSFNSDYK